MHAVHVTVGVMARGRGRTQARRVAAGRRAAQSHAPRFATDHHALLNYEVVTTPRGVREMTSLLARHAQSFALDIETAANRGWGVTKGATRLVQIGVDQPGTGRRQWVIDLAQVRARGIEPLLPLLESEDYEILIHNGNYEQEWIGYEFDTRINGIYDTLVASRAVETELRRHDPHRPKNKNSLDHVLKRISGVAIPKEMQGSNWGREILTEQQMIYAATDVATLPPLAHEIKALAARLGLTEQIAERCAEIPTRTYERLQKIRRNSPDESRRLQAAMARALSRVELDAIWQAGQGMAIDSRNRARLEDVYRAERQRLSDAT